MRSNASQRTLATLRTQAFNPLHCSHRRPQASVHFRQAVHAARTRRSQSQVPLKPAQVVHVRRPPVKTSRWFRWIFYTLVAYQGLGFVFTQLCELVAEETPDDIKDTSKAITSRPVEDDGTVVLDEDDIVFFFPLQLPKMLPRQPYDHNDPEYQEFVKLSQDEQRQENLRAELADQIQNSAIHNGQYRAFLGADIVCSRVWLDCIYPSHKPPVYSRMGVTLITGGIALSEQTMPHSEYVRLRQTIYPSAILAGLSEAIKLYYHLKKIGLKKRLGWSISREELEMQFRALTVHRNFFKMSDPSPGSSNETPSAALHAPGKSLQIASDAVVDASVASDGSSSLRDLLHLFSLEHLASSYSSIFRHRGPTDMGVAIAVGVTHSFWKWHELRMDKAPQGACFFVGCVELSGARTRVKMQVLAAYSPQERKWLWSQFRPALRFGPKPGS